MNTSVHMPGMDRLDTHGAFDWTDLRAAGDDAAEVLAELSINIELLSALVRRTLDDDRLLSMCERHRPFDKIVIYNADDRNFRIRLHIWRDTEFERAHQHRFSFASRMLQGQYRHILYRQVPAEDVSVDPLYARLHPDPEHPDGASRLDPRELTPTLEYDMRTGDGYTLHHEAVHATMISAETVTLILRGPAEKDAAFVADVDGGGVYWRLGQRDEDPERTRAKQMGRDDLTRVIGELRDRGIVV
jgi:hypothetical protein